MHCVKIFDRSAPRKPRLLRRGLGELYEIEKILNVKICPLGQGASLVVLS